METTLESPGSQKTLVLIAIECALMALREREYDAAYRWLVDVERYVEDIEAAF